MPRKAAASALTRHQELVLDALAREDQPASAYALLDHLRDQGLRAPQQIYRALDKLIERGLVHRVESLNSFVACTHPHSHAPHRDTVVFAICDRCGQAHEFSHPTVAQLLGAWADEHGFRMDTAAVELHGLCAPCQRVAAAADAGAGGAAVAEPGAGTDLAASTHTMAAEDPAVDRADRADLSD